MTVELTLLSGGLLKLRSFHRSGGPEYSVNRIVPSEFDKSFAQAIQDGDVSAIEALIRQQPDVVNHAGFVPPPLHCAILWDQLAAAEILLDNGADIEMLDPDRGTTPLRYAIMFCKTDFIPMLLLRGAYAGPSQHNGTTALQLAKAALDGQYDQYDDLPRIQQYEKVVAVLEELGLKQ